MPPSSVVTVMVASPAATAVTMPFSSTVATLSLPLDHVTFLFVASAGVKLGVSWSVSPLLSVAEVSFRLTPVMGTLTVTAQVADFPPAAAVMVAVPPPTAVTTPFSTVATLSSLLVHVTVLNVASSGATVAVSVTVSPLASATES